jgi:hypothetical protein
MQPALPFLLTLGALALSGCGAPQLPTPPPALGVTGGSAPSQLRGVRYCEVLIGGSKGLDVALDVYNTIGLNECPAEAWTRLDAKELEKELGAERVILNGPRYWTIDRLDGSHLLDPTPRDLHGIAMRKAGHLDLSLRDLASEGKYYVRHDVKRTTVWKFDAGKRVYELIDAERRTYVMQSYSVQKAPQTEESLATLAERLHLPSGWSFRSRVLDAELDVLAQEGVAHIVQDDLANTYQQR